MISISASASDNLFWADCSPRTANSAFRSKNLSRFWLCFSVCTTFKSPSLFSLERLEKTWNNSFVVRYQFPGARGTLFQQGWNSACYRAPASAWCSWMSRNVKILRGGDCRVTLRLEAALSSRKVDRRMVAADVDAELWSRIGQMARRSTPERSCTGVSSDSSQRSAAS